MAAATQAFPALVSLEEYLNASYRPDCDYVDGILEERSVGDTQHGIIQMWLGYWFFKHRAEWSVVVIGELRMLVGNRRVRLPDVAVAAIDAALNENPRTTPALIAIEILSPDDRIPRVIPRLREFKNMGVPHVWLIDPIERVPYTFTEFGLNLVETPVLAIPNSPIYLDLSELFAVLSYAK